MTTLEITIRNKATQETTKIDCGVEFKDWTFKAAEERRILAENPNCEIISSCSSSDTPINFVRPVTYGMW